MDLKGVKKEDGKYNLTDKDREHPYCVLEGKGFIKPVAWEIVGKNPAPEHGHLLVFYMLPQSASRKHIKDEVKVDPPDGPDCEELYIEFVRRLNILCKVLSKIFFLSRTSRTTLFCLLAIHQPLPPPQQPRQQHGQRPPLKPLQRPPSQHRLL